MNNEHDNSSNWKWNLFYFNPKDKRIFVPKRIPQLGMTVNFANPVSFLIVISLVVVIAYFVTRS